MKKFIIEESEIKRIISMHRTIKEQTSLGKTVLVISHRSQTLLSADYVLNFAERVKI